MAETRAASIKWTIVAAAAVTAMISFPNQARSISCTMGPFMIFFDLDSDEITPGAAAILENVIGANPGCGGPHRVVILGHADRAGGDRHNLALSQRRAERVRAYLLSRGIQADSTKVAAFGERRPLVETPDGVQEAENRRVEILFDPLIDW